MNKYLFFVALFFSNLNFNPSNQLMQRKNRPAPIQTSFEEIDFQNHDDVVQHQKNEFPYKLSLVALAISVVAALSSCYIDPEVLAVQELKVNCHQPFNESACADSMQGCNYRACTFEAFCNDSNKTCTKSTQLPGCNLTRKQRRALRECQGGKPSQLHTNYSSENPAGYREEQCWRKAYHFWDKNKNKCCHYPKRPYGCQTSNLCFFKPEC